MQEQRALVVDDSKVGRVTMRKKLEAMGVKVDLAESGRIALDYLAFHEPDVIFMDHMMPDLDGFETTRRIKAAPATRNIPVIIVSGNDEANFIESARAAGALNAINKPPADEVLQALLASLPTRAPVAVTAPVPETVTPASTLDMAAVRALLAQLVAEGVAPMHEEIVAEMDRRLAAEISSQRKALEQRLQPLETEAAKPLPDFTVLQTEIAQHVEQLVEKRIADALAESQARSESLVPRLETLRQGFQDLRTRQDERTAQTERMLALLDQRLNTFTNDLERVSRDAQTQATAPAKPDETRLCELIAESLKQRHPVEGPPPLVSARTQTEITELRARLKTLTTLTAIGGTLLLAALGGLVIWG